MTPLLSRMLSVTETVPRAVLEAIGAAKGIGRDRWEELKKLVQIPANADEGNRIRWNRGVHSSGNQG